ncbi:unnamed protein product [Amoebophrya sp. A25]|nr:unnamed protein product [Amoebophrya sp. A25]|eukprot:GSA25T00000767001.1
MGLISATRCATGALSIWGMRPGNAVLLTVKSNASSHDELSSPSYSYRQDVDTPTVPLLGQEALGDIPAVSVEESSTAVGLDIARGLPPCSVDLPSHVWDLIALGVGNPRPKEEIEETLELAQKTKNWRLTFRMTTAKLEKTVRRLQQVRDFLKHCLDEARRCSDKEKTIEYLEHLYEKAAAPTWLQKAASLDLAKRSKLSREFEWKLKDIGATSNANERSTQKCLLLQAEGDLTGFAVSVENLRMEIVLIEKCLASDRCGGHELRNYVLPLTGDDAESERHSLENDPVSANMVDVDP